MPHKNIHASISITRERHALLFPLSLFLSFPFIYYFLFCVFVSICLFVELKPLHTLQQHSQTCVTSCSCTARSGGCLISYAFIPLPLPLLSCSVFNLFLFICSLFLFYFSLSHDVCLFVFVFVFYD